MQEHLITNHSQPKWISGNITLEHILPIHQLTSSSHSNQNTDALQIQRLTSLPHSNKLKH